MSLHYLRGLAALLVVYAHVFVVSITDHVTPKAYLPMIIGTPVEPAQVQAADIYLWPEYFLQRQKTSSGEIGVLLFFLISGCVILKSLDNAGPLRFLVRRLFRIYPLVVVVVLTTAAAFSLYAWAYGQVGPYSVANTVANALLLSGWFGIFYTIPLLWTLMVEVCFYVTLAFCGHIWKTLYYKHLVLIGMACLLLAYVGAVPPAELTFAALPLRFAGYNGVYIIYMLIGCAVWRAVSCPTHVIAGASTVLALAAMFTIARSVFEANVPSLEGHGAVGGAAAFIVFVAALAAEKVLPRSWMLSFLGDISYPLYIIHVPLAWAIIFELSRRQFSVHLALVTATLMSLLLAWVLHVLVERRCNLYGIRISSRWVEPQH